jgi:tetratricopeptide (TPR) repeat protein
VDAGSPDRALSILAVATVINPAAASLYSDLAYRLSQMGDLDSALITIRRALALDPENVDWQRHLARILAVRGDEVGFGIVLHRIAVRERDRIGADPGREVDQMFGDDGGGGSIAEVG